MSITIKQLIIASCAWCFVYLISSLLLIKYLRVVSQSKIVWLILLPVLRLVILSYIVIQHKDTKKWFSALLLSWWVIPIILMFVPMPLTVYIIVSYMLRIVFLGYDYVNIFNFVVENTKLVKVIGVLSSISLPVAAIFVGVLMKQYDIMPYAESPDSKMSDSET